MPRCATTGLKYYPAQTRGSGTVFGDVLVVGLQGRGIWLLPGAGPRLLFPDPVGSSPTPSGILRKCRRRRPESTRGTSASSTRDLACANHCVLAEPRLLPAHVRAASARTIRCSAGPRVALRPESVDVIPLPEAIRVELPIYGAQVLPGS